MGNNKIKTLEEIAVLAESLRKQGKKIVQCHGCFDIVHPGHIEHFEEAREQGDILIVTVTPDEYVGKGPDRPYFQQNLRLKQIAAQESVDYVVLNKYETAIESIGIIKPHVYVKGKEILNNQNIDKVDGKFSFPLEEKAVKSIGGKVYLTDGIVFSSSSIINKFGDTPDELKSFLSKIKEKYNRDKILSTLDSLKDIKVLTIGDTIIDEYIFCEAMEKSAKDAVIARKILRSESHAGGTLAIANHLAGFTDDITLISCKGNNHSDTIENSLNQKIQRKIYTQPNLETLVISRFVDNYRHTKDFITYNTDELNISKENEEEILQYLDDNLSKFDLIMVSDFGHGMLTDNLRDKITQSRNFLALNVQLNGGNLGYNFVTNYKKADFVSLNHREIRLPFQQKKGDIKIPIIKLSQQLHVDKINVTLGKQGSLYFNKGEFYEAPPFTTTPVDTIGSGDAVYALGSLLAYKNVDPYLFSFLVNSIGGLATQIMGNRTAVNPLDLKRFISQSLK